MGEEVYRYAFAADVPLEDAESSLIFAVMAAESLHGQSQVRLDAGHSFDREKRQLVIDASTQVGRDLNRLFLGFLSRECGEDSFRVERLTRSVKEHQEAA